jgi:hypothetical protein
LVVRVFQKQKNGDKSPEKNTVPHPWVTIRKARAKWTIYLPIRSYLVGINRRSTSYKMGYHDETRY